MRIVCLSENTVGAAGCGAEHGLCFYIETAKHRLLMDTGASDLFIRNAEMLGVNLTKVDTVILSHGHHDHGGGILPFVKMNQKAKIYMQRSATGEFYSDEAGGKLKNIGLPAEIAGLPQVVFVEGDLQIDKELFLMSNIGYGHPIPSGCLRQRMKVEQGFVQDDYRHEQCLVIKQGKKLYLFSGCAHHGILNVMDRFRALYGKDPDAVFSGMHMMKKGEQTREEKAAIKDTACELKKTSTHFYTGHCTGVEAFDTMRGVLGGQISYVHSGDELELAGPGQKVLRVVKSHPKECAAGLAACVLTAAVIIAVKKLRK